MFHACATQMPRYHRRERWGQNRSPDPTEEPRYSFTASAKYCSYTSSALLALVTTSSTGASG